MNRLLACLLLATLALAGCGGDDGDGGAAPTETAIPEERLATSTEDSNAPPGALREEPTAQEVVEHFVTIGLDVPNPTDSTEQECQAHGCVEHISSGTVDVIRFEADSDAAAHEEMLGDAGHRNGLVVLEYAETTDEDARGEYEAALAELVGV